jgi:HD-GYP domain-containing protein (c-di-GMP phosphodiesterase class II)
MNIADLPLRKMQDVESTRAKVHECMLLLTRSPQAAAQAASDLSETIRQLIAGGPARLEVSIGRVGERRSLRCTMVTASQPAPVLEACLDEQRQWRVVRDYPAGTSWIANDMLDRLGEVLAMKSHQELLEENLRLLHDKTTALNRLSLQLSTTQDVDTLMIRMLREAGQAFCCEAGSILMAEDGALVFRHALNASEKSTERLLVRPDAPTRLPIDRQSMAGAAALDGLVVVKDAYEIPETETFRFNPAMDRMTGLRTRAVISVSLRSSQDELLGVLQLVNPRDPETLRDIEFSKEDEALVMNFGSLASVALERSNLTRTMVLRIMSQVQLFDPKETGAHVRRVSQVAARLFVGWANRRHWPEERILKELDALRLAAMLHDQGKSGIGDIIRKPGLLTPEERAIMQTHPLIGVGLMSGNRTALDPAVRDIMLYHHARWDGTGYPTHAEILRALEERGLDPSLGPEPKGESIPIFGRVVAVADVFDALMSRRAYKEAWKPQDVRAEFERSAGTHFDPELVELLVADFDAFCQIHSAISD